MELGELGSVRVVVAIYLTLNSFLTRGLLTKFSDKECKHKKLKAVKNCELNRSQKSSFAGKGFLLIQLYKEPA